MAILGGLIGLLAGAFAAALITRRRAAVEMTRLRVRLDERVCFWQGETERARATAAQAAERTAAWVAGCEQGREDMLSLARTLGQRGIGAQEEAGPGSTLAGQFVPRMREGGGEGPRTTVRSA